MNKKGEKGKNSVMKKKWMLGLAMSLSVTCLTACSSIDLPDPLENFFGGSKG